MDNMVDGEAICHASHKKHIEISQHDDKCQAGLL